MSDHQTTDGAGLVCAATGHLRDSISRMLQAMAELETAHERLLGPRLDTCDPTEAPKKPSGEMGSLVAECSYLESAVNRLAELARCMSRL